MSDGGRPAEGPKPDKPSTGGLDAGWSIISYLLGGMLVWGGVGWLVDRWVGTDPAFLVVGLLVGIVGAITIVFIRYGR